MNKIIREQLVKETAQFLDCDLLTAEKKADEWVKKCTDFYHVDKDIQNTKKKVRQIIQQQEQLMDTEELKGEQILKEMFVQAEKVITKDN